MPRPARARLVLRTEARRLSRRASTWALRWAWAAALAATIGLLWASALQDPRVDAARLSHRLFGAYRDLVLLVAVGLAPLLVAIGAAEDREDGSLPVLVLAGLDPRRVLVSRAAARLVAVATIVLGGLPVAALLAAMGGVNPWAVVNATANALGLMLALGVVAGALAAGSGRVFAAVLAALTWGWLAFFGLPSLLEYALYSEVFLDWRGQGFLRRWLEVVWQFGFDLRPGTEVLSPVAAMRAETASGLLPLLSVAVAVAAVALAARLHGAVRALVVIALPLGVLLWAWGLRRPEAEARPVLWLGALLLLGGGTAVFLDGARWVLQPPVFPESRPPRQVRGDPVLWRELLHRGWAGVRPWAWWGAGLWSAALLAGWWAAPASVARAPHLEAGAALWVVGVLGVALTATACIVTEVGEGTWPLLVATPRPTRRLVGTKILVSGVYALPVLLLAAATRGLPWLPWALGLWAALTLACMGAVLWVRPARLAWTVNLSVAAALLVGGTWWRGVLPLWAGLVPLALALALFPVVTWSAEKRAGA